MSQHTHTTLRQVVELDSLGGTHHFATSAFAPSNQQVIEADPAHILQIATRTYSPNEKLGAKLAGYRMDKIFDESVECPIVFPTVSIMGGDVKIYDVDLLKSLVERGFEKMRLHVIGMGDEVEEFVSKHGTSEEIKKISDYRVDFEPNAAGTKLGSNYTTAMHISELTESIDAHVSSAQSKHFSDKSGFYDAFTTNQDMLDLFITSGRQSLNVDRCWDGESIGVSLMSALQDFRTKMEGGDVSPMDLVDRFERLHQRLEVRQKMAKASYIGVIDEGSEARIFKMMERLGEKIADNEEARTLLLSEASPAAKNYFSALTHKGVAPSAGQNMDFKFRDE